ncbi:MAG: hypothetical protein ACHQKZ_01125 [Solirubrobacterales bacterium]
MFRRAQAVALALAMAVVILTPRPASSQAADGAASPAGKTYVVFLFDSSQNPIPACLTFDADGGFSSEIFGSGGWQAIPFGSAAFWWATASHGSVASSELIGFAFPETAAVLSGMARITVVESGEEFSFGMFGFETPTCNGAKPGDTGSGARPALPSWFHRP